MTAYKVLRWDFEVRRILQKYFCKIYFLACNLVFIYAFCAQSLFEDYEFFLIVTMFLTFCPVSFCFCFDTLLQDLSTL